MCEIALYLLMKCVRDKGLPLTDISRSKHNFFKRKILIDPQKTAYLHSACQILVEAGR